jgi:hypothetical protein
MRSLLLCFSLLFATAAVAQPKPAALPPFVSHDEAETAVCPSDEPCLYYEDSAYVLRKNGTKGSWIVDVGLPDLPILKGIKTNGEVIERATKAMTELVKQLKAPTVKVYCGAVKWLDLPLPHNQLGALVVDVPPGAVDKMVKPLLPKQVNELIAKRRELLHLAPAQFFDDKTLAQMVKPGVGDAPYISARAGRFPSGTGHYDLRLWLVYSPDYHDVFVLDRSGSGDAAWASQEETVKRGAADDSALVRWLQAAGIHRVALMPGEECNTPGLLGGQWLTWTVEKK